MTATSLIQRNAYRLCSNFNSAFENGRRSSLRCFGLAKAAVHGHQQRRELAPVLLSNLHFKSLWKRIMSTDEAIADRSIMYEASWNSRYEELLQYKKDHDNTLVPAVYEENPSLGKWVNSQRTFYKDNKLSPERVEKLNEVGFVWDALEAQWSEYFEQLLQYKKEHGDTLVSQGYEANPSLAFWVNNQRSNYNGNKLSPARIKKLNEIEFVWDAQEAQWLEYFEQLLQYKEEHGNTLVPKRYEENKQLGRWVIRQRVNFHAKTLLSERREKLDEIGFVWDPIEAQWLECFGQLKEYRRYHGDTLVPNRYSSNPSLGKWVSTQRYEYRKFMASKKLEEDGSLLNNIDKPEIEKISNSYTRMTEERIRQLEAEDFIWDPRDYAWQIKYEEMCEWIALNGHGAIRLSSKQCSSLADWARGQRQMYKKYLNGEKIGLPKEAIETRIEKLERAGFVFELARAT